MRNLLRTWVLTFTLLLISSGVQAENVYTLLSAETATSGTAIESNATVCESDPVYYETNATVCETDAGDLRVVTVFPKTLAVGDSVVFADGTGGTCTGITAGTVYFVTQVDNPHKFNIAATAGGTNITYTDTGTAFNAAVTTLRIQTVAAHSLLQGDSVSFAAGTGAVCTGITAGNVYYATQIDSTTEFNISNTFEGAPIVYTDTGTAFTSNTSGVGPAVPLGKDYEDFTCVVTWGGTVPTNTTVILYGSIDGSNFTQIDSRAITATGSNYVLNNYPYLYLLGEFSAKTAGDATTAVTLKCMSGRN